MAAGSWHTVACTRTGELLAWGYGGFGQLGLGEQLGAEESPSYMPAKLSLAREARAAVARTAEEAAQVVADECRFGISARFPFRKCWSANFF